MTVGLKDNEVEQAYNDKDTVANWFKENRGKYGEIRYVIDFATKNNI